MENVNENFGMPIDFLVNGKPKRFNPSTDFKSFDISKHSQVEVMDWRFYVLPKEVSNE